MEAGDENKVAAPRPASTAVMARRKKGTARALDDFPTPPWATRALIESVLKPYHGRLNPGVAWEPAANRGHMALPLREYFPTVVASDVRSYPDARAGFALDGTADFLLPYNEWPQHISARPGWIITNPPFRLAAQFIDRALDYLPEFGVAMIVRLQFLEGVDRWHRLFRSRPPSIIAQFTERVPMFEARLDKDGASATAYCWLVWLTGSTGVTRFEWIAPCRRRLERPGDYGEGKHGGTTEGGSLFDGDDGGGGVGGVDGAVPERAGGDDARAAADRGAGRDQAPPAEEQAPRVEPPAP